MNENVVKTLNYIKRNGLVAAIHAISERMNDKAYLSYDFVDISEEERLNQLSRGLEYKTSFSIAVPAYETPEEYMKALIDSVVRQTYASWELVIADASKTDIVKNTVDKYVDKRIKYVKLEVNKGISGNTNEALKYCSNEYVALLDHDDVITQDALYEMAKAISENREKGITLQMLYSDEDKTNAENTEFFQVHKKPKFNLDLILSNNYICHFLVIKADLIRSCGLRSEYDGAQDYDLILRCISKIRKDSNEEGTASPEDVIFHIGKVLYHWRSHKNSTALNPKSKEYAYAAGQRAIEDFLKRENIKATVKELPPVGFYYTEYEPDIFTQRSDVGAVGCRVINKKGKVCGGVYDEDMNIMFEGLSRHNSGGYLHRAFCMQDVPFVNVKAMIPSDKGAEILSRVIRENSLEDKDIDKINELFGKALKEEGLKIVYDPMVTMKEKDV